MADELTLSGRAAIVTGAGNGLGQAESLALARTGALLVLNDRPGDAIQETAEQMIFSMSAEEWDLVLRVHLRGHFVTTRFATEHWRAASKQAGGPVYGRIVNTTSESFLLGTPGQPNYAAAKAGIAALTVTTARGCARYGVRANAICPRARTAMVAGMMSPPPDDGPDPIAPEHVTPLVTYLASPAAERINGEVFIVHGGVAAVMNPPSIRAVFHADTPDGLWTLPAVHEALAGEFADHSPDSPGSPPPRQCPWPPRPSASTSGLVLQPPARSGDGHVADPARTLSVPVRGEEQGPALIMTPYRQFAVIVRGLVRCACVSGLVAHESDCARLGNSEHQQARDRRCPGAEGLVRPVAVRDGEHDAVSHLAQNSRRQVPCEHVAVLAPLHEASQEQVDRAELAVDRLAELATAQRQQHAVPVRHRPDAGDEPGPRRVRCGVGGVDVGEHGRHLGDGPVRERPD